MVRLEGAVSAESNRHELPRIDTAVLFALIAIVWLTVATFCWAACAMAARGDAGSSLWPAENPVDMAPIRSRAGLPKS